MRAGRESHAAHGHFQSALASVVQSAVFAQQSRRNVRVVVAAPLLNDSRRDHPVANFSRGNAVVLAPQLLVSDCRDFDMDIDAIE